jgi:hypothetical protein
MKTMTAQTVIAPDGKLRLELATDLPPGPADVVVIVEPKPSDPPGSFPSLKGKLAGKMPANLDVVEETRQIRQRATVEAQELPQ